MFRFHSKVGLVSNSSGEVFIARKDQIPENVDDVIRTLWTVWKSQHADAWELERIETLNGFDPAELFEMEPMISEDDIHYGRNYEKKDAIRSFLSQCDRINGGLPGMIDQSTVDRVIAGHPDVEVVVDYYDYIQKVWDESGRQTTGDFWVWEAVDHISQMAVDLDLFDEFEQIASLFASSEGMFSQWRYVDQSFKMYHAYENADFQGEVDDHVYPSGFVRFVCDTLGWFTYHNG